MNRSFLRVVLAGSLVGAACLAAAPPVSAAKVRTCLSYEDAKTDCWNKNRWTYEFCFDRPAKQLTLERYIENEWRMIKRSKMNKGSGCPPDHPWELTVSYRMPTDGIRQYRWVLSYGERYADVYDYFTASRTTK